MVTCLKEYISRIELIRENLEGNKDQLILSYAYPHKPINCHQSTARYIKLFLELSGIDVTAFTAHSTRSTSTSKANNVGLCLKETENAAVLRLGNITANLPLIKNFEKEILGDFNNKSCN